jgi:hypothetical protein
MIVLPEWHGVCFPVVEWAALRSKISMIFDFILRNSQITDDAASVDFSAIWMVSRQFHQHRGGEECATVGGALPLSVLPCGPIDAGACAAAMQATHLCRLEPVRTCFGA